MPSCVCCQPLRRVWRSVASRRPHGPTTITFVALAARGAVLYPVGHATAPLIFPPHLAQSFAAFPHVLVNRITIMLLLSFRWVYYNITTTPCQPPSQTPTPPTTMPTSNAATMRPAS